MVLLKNKTNLLVAQRGTLLRFQMMNGRFVEKIFAAPTVVVHSKNVEQRRFAGAGGSHHRNELALRNLDIDVAQDVEKSSFCQRIRALEVVKPDHKFTLRAMLGLDLPASRVALVTRWQ